LDPLWRLSFSPGSSRPIVRDEWAFAGGMRLGGLLNAAALIHPAAIVQNCYVVANLDHACRQFYAAYGIGSFLGGGEILLDHHVYRGEPAPPVRLRGVFVQTGDLNIELVQVLWDGPSAFKEMFPAGPPVGFHHAAMF